MGVGNMKMMHLGDLHIGKVVNGISMLEDQIHILNQIKDYINVHQPNVLLIAGDIYDRSVPPAAAVTVFSDFLSDVLLNLKTPVLAVAGNHDGAELISYGNEIFGKMNFHIEGKLQATIKKVTLTEEVGPVNFYLLPFADYAVARDVLENKEIKSLHSATEAMLLNNPIDSNERNVLITHAFVTGGGDVEQSESEKSLVVGGKEDVALSLFKDFDYVALGHLHGAQRVGSNKVRYSGTPLKYSISEEHHKKSVTLIELKEKDDLTIALLPLTPLRDMRTLKGTLEELTLSGEVSGKYDYLRVILTDDGELIEPMAKLRAVYPNVMSLEFSANRGSFSVSNLTSEVRKSKSPHELFADFYEHAKGEPLSEEKQAVLDATIKQLIGGVQ